MKNFESGRPILSEEIHEKEKEKKFFVKRVQRGGEQLWKRVKYRKIFGGLRFHARGGNEARPSQ